jgi:hypothetical protein
MRRLRAVFGLVLTICVCSSLFSTSASQAMAEQAQGTLFYDQSSVTLVNTGQILLDIMPLIFVRDDAQAPARFEARSWSVQSLAPGECVQLRITAHAGKVHAGCRQLVRWQWNGQSTTHFWIASDNAKYFRVVIGSTDLLACEIGKGQCVFSYDRVPIVENLILTYSLDTLTVRNGALTATPLTRLAFCRTAVGPVCVEPRRWRLTNTPEKFEAGACIELKLASAASATSRANRETCVVTYMQENAFWRQPFTVISPITARATVCPGLPREGSLRCMVPR